MIGPRVRWVLFATALLCLLAGSIRTYHLSYAHQQGIDRLLSFRDYYHSGSAPSAAAVDAISDGPLVPARLEIPSLRLSPTEVTPVELDEAGSLEIPDTGVGWYSLGPAPLEAGSAVFVAHVSYNHARGAFHDLQEVALGSQIRVTMSDESLVEYTVVSLNLINKEDVPFEKLFTFDGPEQIVLITCGGRFDRAKRSYESNVISVAYRTTPSE